MAAPAVAHTVLTAIIACGIPNGAPLFGGRTQAQRISEDIFNDDFSTVLDMTFKDLDTEFKSYSELTAANGRIQLNPTQKRNIKAFMQWCNDTHRMSQDPTIEIFDPNDAMMLIRRNNTHKMFVDKSKTITDTAKPRHFTNDSKWDEWKPTLLNFLRSIPGRNGVPLSYICREEDAPAVTYDHNIDFIDNYVLMAPITGDAFTIDAAEVHTYITRFMAGNTVAETKMLPHVNEANGRKDFIALKEHFEGIGINSINILKADEILEKLHYTGEKKPHMWWDEFERQLTYAFAIYDKKENRSVFSDEMKLRYLTKKISVDYLNAMKASINIELTKVPVTMTYNQAVTAFRNEVNRKFTPETSSGGGRNVRRRIQELKGRGGRDGNPRGGRGRGGRGRGRGGRGRGNGGHTQHPDERYITGKDGKTMAVHASYHMHPHQWNNLPDVERQRITKEREEYRKNKRVRISEVQQDDVPPVTSTAIVPHQSNLSQVNTGGTVMGGRIEQQMLRSRNPNNR